MVQPKGYQEFLVYTSNIGETARPYTAFRGVNSTRWFPIDAWDVYKNKRLREGWVDITDKLIDRNEILRKSGIYDFENSESIIYNTETNATEIFKKIDYILNGFSTSMVGPNAKKLFLEDLGFDKFYNTNILLYTDEAVKEANECLEELSKIEITENSEGIISKINEVLRKLYITLPSVIDNVANIYMTDNSEKDLSNIKDREKRRIGSIKKESSDLLEQYILFSPTEEGPTEVNLETKNGIVNLRNKDAQLEELVMKKLEKLDNSQYSYSNCWYVNCNSRRSAYERDASRYLDLHKNYRILWHGSGTENWKELILSGGPDMDHASVGMFGKGLYFADIPNKSLNYTTQKYAIHNTSKLKLNESAPCYIGLFKVRVGKKYKLYNSNSRLTYERIQQEGRYDSVMGCAGPSLRMNEYIVYRDQQVDMIALVEISIK